MNYRIIPFLFIIFILAFSNQNKHPYPQHFRAPIDGEILLSGTFCELRSDHFHSGIDIKGYLGKDLLAIDEGYVSRIKVQEGGYGNALYIDHPSGYTSVYCHLDRFTSELEHFVKSHQYNKERFEVDLYPEKERFKFTKGQKVGDMGTSGRSFGPHLHFEIRETKSQKALNPLRFGFEVKDHRHPRMHQLKVYELNEQCETTASSHYSLHRSGNQYSPSKKTILTSSEFTGLGLKVYDHMDGAPNWNGIYSLELLVDDSLHLAFEMEKLAFNETRYLNARQQWHGTVTLAYGR